ncbi:hypothetical protein [uncultured Dokdonia sp.]|uniref:hypothetical protein n=1 Tax=uncultured Dokdonia sp. TaxID=575653 RepID=UPI0026142802|nr:hypothetical protein [uncultured Dokdonia sp.]
MEKSKSKCKCAQTGGICGRKLSLIKQGKLTLEAGSKEILCPLKSALIYTS